MTEKPSTKKFQPKPRTWAAKFSDALIGLVLGVSGQSSFVIHFFFAAASGLVAWFLKVSLIEVAILAVTIGLVLSMELVNSALEVLAKAVTDQEDTRIDHCLKIASSAVLVSAVASVVVGITIFGPRLWQLIF